MLPDQMAHDIFISYAHQDKLLADALCSTLEHSGLRCWIAPRDVPPGAWGAAIVNAIEASRAFVLLFSSWSNTSNQVYNEIVHAAGRGLIIVPVRIEDVPLSKDIKLLLYYEAPLVRCIDPTESSFNSK